MKRNTPQVKVAQPLFLKLVLLGCIVSSSTIIAMSIEDEGADKRDGDGPRVNVVPACAMIPW